MMNPIRTTRRRAARGVTLAELLVVLAIISLLATLAVPVYVSRAEQARRATARAEVRAIAEAQEMVGALYGFYVPIHTLDKVPERIGADNGDNWPDYPGTAFFIRIGQRVNDQAGSQIQYSGTLGAGNQDIRPLIENWQGPFLNAVRKFRQSGATNPSDFTTNDIHFDLVLDPWGRPYRLFTPEGITGTSNTTSNHGQIPAASPNTVDNGFINIQTGTIQAKFDRFAIVSFGPDGVLDAANSDFPDDIFYEFGSLPNPEGFANF